MCIGTHLKITSISKVWTDVLLCLWLEKFGMLRLTSGFCHILAGGSSPMGRCCKAKLLHAWPLDSVRVVPVSLGCSCLSRDWEWPATGSPMTSDSPLPTTLFHGRTWGAGICIGAVAYGQDIIDLWICTGTSWLLLARAVVLLLF